MNLYFEETCAACPEQYDVLDDVELQIVAYVRLRWGCLRVYVPDAGGVLVYEHTFTNAFQGQFESATERKYHLDKILEVLEHYYAIV